MRGMRKCTKFLVQASGMGLGFLSARGSLLPLHKGHKVKENGLI